MVKWYHFLMDRNEYTVIAAKLRAMKTFELKKPSDFKEANKQTTFTYFVFLWKPSSRGYAKTILGSLKVSIIHL